MEDRILLNLIVVCKGDTWSSLPAFLEHEWCLTEYILPEFKERYSGLSSDAITEIKQFPCIFAYENINKKEALIGYIKNIEVQQKMCE